MQQQLHVQQPVQASSTQHAMLTQDPLHWEMTEMLLQLSWDVVLHAVGLWSPGHCCALLS
jgi:hypothetical protein